jgi:WD40-like Beta Propeller Repeat
MESTRTKSKRGLGMRLLATLGALTALACGTAFATTESTGAGVSAQTGSIVFEKRSDGNIWLARPDGSHQRRVTRNGTSADPYEHPTQADNGTIVAARGFKLGTSFYRLSPNGRLLNRPREMSDGFANEGPIHLLTFSPAVSPDGKRIASYHIAVQGVFNGRTRLDELHHVAQAIEYRNAGSGKVTYRRFLTGVEIQSPSWIDNRRTLVFAPNRTYPGLAQVFVDTPGGKLQGWFWDPPPAGGSSFDMKFLDQGELTRAGDKLAVIRGPNTVKDWRQTTIQIYSVKGLGTAPTALCAIRATGPGPFATFADPTWSPDGTTLAWSARGGIWSSKVLPNQEGCRLSPKLIIRGGSAPDWGPAGAR